MSRTQLSSVVSRQIPEFIREDYPTFVAFVEAYYEYLQEQGVDLSTARDIDTTLDEFVVQFKKELAHNLPNIAVDERFILSHIKDQYLSKGSESSYKLLFRLLFGKNVELFYTESIILKASDGIWKKDRTIRVSVPANTNGFDFIRTKITGEISKATAIVNNVIKLQVKDTNVYELYLEDIEGNFTYEKVIANKLITAPSTFTTVSANTIPVLINVDIINSKSGYTANSKIS
jgi:hypothetical protein